MDHQNIDRLFREKLDSLEAVPSSKAWTELEQQLRPKNKGISVYWVAASIVAIVIASTLLITRNDHLDNGAIIAENDYPALAQQPKFEAPVAAVLNENEGQKNSNTRTKSLKSKVKTVNSSLASMEASTKKIASDAVDSIAALDIKTMVASEETSILPEEIEQISIQSPLETSSEKKKIKITYIASNVKPAENQIQDRDSTGVLKKFIAFAEKIDPGEMLADIRTAKDNFISGGLKNKKDRNTISP
ncbi:MAG: hypothetical protein Tsb0034_26380 [Ekhidna sp.]